MNLEIITLEEINKLTPLEAFEAGFREGQKEAREVCCGGCMYCTD